MTRTVLIYGDSNSHGTAPMTTRGSMTRYGRATRWPGVLAEALGSDWEVIEEALPGRTAAKLDDPVMGEHMNGPIGLRIALQSHGPIDLLVIMLGTNDTKRRFAPTPEKVVAGVAGLLDLALGLEYQERHGGFEVLVIAPVPVQEHGVIAGEFLGAAEISRGVAPLLRAHCTARGVAFLDAGEVATTSQVEGVHLDPEAHRAIGTMVAAKIAQL